MDKLYFLDLFCGAGGTSEGIKHACQRLGLDYWLTAVNHWSDAIKVHRANHPGSHHTEDIFKLNPNRMVPGGRVDVMCASPECIFHCDARGGGPCNEQSRSAAFTLLQWTRKLDVKWLIIENVAEFMKWGPLGKDGRPIKGRESEYFNKWLRKLKRQGYRYEYQVLNAADYGAHTARKRFFLIATKTNKKILWPEKTHADNWNPAREIIDWELKGQSVFLQKDLCRNSMRRICYGLDKFNGIQLDLDYAMECSTKKILPEIRYTPEVAAFFAKYNGTAKDKPRVHSVEEPMRTVDTSNRFALITPFFTQMYGTGRARSVERPMASQPGKPKSYLAEPYICETYGQSNAVDINNPVPSIMTNPKGYVAEPYLLPQQQGYDKLRVTSLNKPMPTIASRGADALLQPYLSKYYGTGRAVSVDSPLDTVTTKDRFGVCEPSMQPRHLDVDYRLMEPHELSAAMGFPSDYIFDVGKTKWKKMIGK